MIRSAASKVMWVGRATVFLVGLAVILALVFGVASTATAHGGYKGLLHLGHSKAVAKVTTLVGQVASGEAFVVKNPSGGAALGLSVGDPLADPATKTVAPMEVDSQAKVGNLNADQLDGMDSNDLAPKAHPHSGADISSGTVAEARIDGTVARDSEVMPMVKANDGAGSGVDADTLDGQSSGAFASSTHNHDGRYYSSGSKVADSDKLDGKDSSAFGIRTEHNYAITGDCDTPNVWNECAPVTVTVPAGKTYYASVWSSFSARHSEGFGDFQSVLYCAAGEGSGISTTNPCITPFGYDNRIHRLDEWGDTGSSSGESVSLSEGTYTFFTALKPSDAFGRDLDDVVITKVMVRDATNGL